MASTQTIETVLIQGVIGTVRRFTIYESRIPAATTSVPMGWYPLAPDPEKVRLATLRETKRAVLGPRRSRWS